MANITKRPRVDGTTALMVRWCGPGTRRQHGLTVPSESDAVELLRTLNSNGQSLEPALRHISQQKSAVPTAGQVVQKRINLLVRPSSGSTWTLPADACPGRRQGPSVAK